MKLSVIIPCLNAEATIAQQLEALAAQQWSEPWELIVSDNGSTDHSVEVARRFENRFLKFRVVDASDRKGGAHACNVGVRAATAEAVAVCDADDEVAPGWVASMGEALFKHNVGCGQMRFDKFNEPDRAKKAAEGWKDGLYKGRFLPGGGSGNFGIRRWVHEAIGGFDESLPHAYDADYFWRLQLERFKLHYLPEAMVQVRLARVNPSLPLLFRRGRNRAASNYWCYKRYRHLGMLPPPPLSKSLTQWLYAFRRAVVAILLYRKQKKVEWLHPLAKRTGDLVGQLQGRMTNLGQPYYPGQMGGVGTEKRSL